jgi:hypothetical protein
MRHIFPLLFLLLFFPPAPLYADSGISCHCFQNRAYDPDQPGAADDYILATTRNSFISALFHIPKQQIVKARMSGTPGEALWLAGYLSLQTGQSVAALLAVRQRATDWNAFLVSLDGFPETLDPEVAAPVLARKPVPAVVSALVDLQVRKRLGLAAVEIETVRSEGATDQQLILVALLASHTGKPAVEIYNQRKRDGLPWDMLLNQNDIAPKQIDSLLRKILGSPL